MIGQHLAHFKILEKLGTGGMGEVYVGEDTKLGRRVAVKVLPRDLAKSADRRMRFEREARAIAALNHNNIVTIHSVEEADGIPFLVMELVQGVDLSEHIPKGGMRLPELFRFAIPLAEALAAAHKENITHRDLKPANVMVNQEGTVKVLDFGLAKLMTPDGGPEEATIAMQEGHTEEGVVLGTVAYMSPEQAEGKTVDARSDIFSLGVLLYEMATGSRPFAGDTRISTITSILRDEPLAVTEVNRGLPRHLGRIIKHCMAKKPEERYQSAIDVRNELRALHQEITSGEFHEERRSEGPPPASRPTGRRMNKVATGVGAAALVVLALLFVFGRSFVSPGHETPSVVTVDSGSTVGVIGFENLTDPNDEEQIGRMLMGLVTTGLAESGGMQVISSPKVLAALREVHGDRTFESAIAARVAEKAGADVMLVGQVMRDGDGVILTAELIDVGSGNAMGSIRKQARSRSELFQLADALADEVRDTLGVGVAEKEQPAVDLARTLTNSPAAYRAYIAGEAALQARQFQSAIDKLERAVQLDSTFALAYHTLAVAAGWMERGEKAQWASTQAVRWSSRLPDRWRIVVRAKRDVEHSSHDAAYEGLRTLVDANTDIAEAHYLFGEIAEHVPKYNDREVSQRSFKRALELDPTYTIVLFHLIINYIIDNQLDEAWSIVKRFEAQSPHDTSVLDAKLMLLRHEERYEEAEALADELAEINLSGSWMSIIPTFSAIDSLEKVERLLKRVIETKSDAFATGYLASARILQGRFRQGIALQIESVESMRKRHGVLTQTAISLARLGWFHAIAGDYDEAVAALRESRALDPWTPKTTYHLGRALAMSARDPSAREAFSAFDSIAAHRGSPELEAFRSLLEAEIHFIQGDPDAAWRMLESIQVSAFGGFSHGEDYWLLRARVLEARGDEAGALSAYRKIDTPAVRGPYPHFVLETLCLYPRAKLEEATGDLASAREHYRLYVRRFGNADVAIPGIDDARARLDALRTAP